MQNKNDVMMTDLKKKVVGMRKENSIGVSAMYNFRPDPDLGVGKIAIRRIPCACDGCLGQLNYVWKEGTIDEEQPRYKTTLKCELKHILECLNEWRVTNLLQAKTMKYMMMN